MVNIIVLVAALICIISCEQVSNATVSEEEVDFNLLRVPIKMRETENEAYDVVDITTDVTTEESGIIFWFFSRDNPKDGIAVNRIETEKLDETSFSVSRGTIFLIHGWNNNNESAFSIIVREAAVASIDVNVFVVDWSAIAKRLYISARRSVKKVGWYVAHFINTLVWKYRLQLSTITLVGHSLGAHVAGNAGAALNGQVATIVGLDPALPLFKFADSDDRLDFTDAEFVQIIHTDGGAKGFSDSIGDSDYFPNGGRKQPGCGVDLNSSCAHARAYRYYAESLSSTHFVAVACHSYEAYTNGECIHGATSVMGTYNIDKSAIGNYYLTTGSESPFAEA